jgi:hypothetical protein
VFLFNYIARTNVLFANYFKTPVVSFYKKHLLYFLVMASVCALTYLCCSMVADETILGLLLRGVICVVVPNALFLGAYCKTTQFRESVQLVKAVLKTR